MIKSIFSFVFITGALVFAAYSWVFQTGLYAYLVRWQVATFDTYFPMLSFAAIFLGLLSVLALLEFLMGIGKSKQFKANLKVDAEQVNRQFSKRMRGFLLLAFIFFIAAFTSFYLGQHAPGDNQIATKIDLNDFEQKNYWLKKVELNGTLLSDSEYTIVSTRNRGQGTSETSYAPITARGNSGAPIHFVYVKSSNTNIRSSSKLAMSGFVMPTVLPVLVRDHFESQGLVLAPRVHMIGKTVVSLQMALFIAAVILALIAFILLVSALMIPFAKRRRLKELQRYN